MSYVGIHTQQVQNNMKSILLLILFPCIVLGMVYAFLAITNMYEVPDGYQSSRFVVDTATANAAFLEALPWVVGIVGIWFLISYFTNASMVRQATGARSLERRDNPRVYNIVENLTMACGMPMPKINVIDDPQLNAFASGIDEKSYTVTVTTGICNRLNDDELAGVIAHELTHIRNRDTRLLIVSIIFVGIMGTALSLAVRMLWNAFLFGGGSRRSDREGKNNGGMIVVIVIAVVLAAVGYFFTMLTRFAISRKREYMADAGGAELCGNPLALASALRKISVDSRIENLDKMKSMSSACIANPAKPREFLGDLLATHPPIDKRIKRLESMNIK